MHQVKSIMYAFYIPPSQFLMVSSNFSQFLSVNIVQMHSMKLNMFCAKYNINELIAL
jgi:hypothetical protein